MNGQRGMLVLALLAGMAAWFPQPVMAGARSFSCEMAHTKDEEAVCHSRWLEQLDTIMAAQYLALKKYARLQRTARPDDVVKWKRELAHGQQGFVAARAECGADEDCIGKVYERRIGELVHMWKEMMR